MKKLLKKFVYLGATLGLLVSNIGSVGQVFAVDGPYTTVSAVDDSCKVGKNINNEFTDIKIEHKKWNGNVGSYADPSDKNWQPNNYQNIHTFFDGTLKNEDMSLKKGDFFTVQLPQETRFNDLLQQDLARAKDLYATDGSGALVATAHFDPATKMITYIFTDYVESHKDIRIHAEYIETLNQDKLIGNIDYTFTGTYAGMQSSYTYYLDNWRADDVNRFNSVSSEEPVQVVTKLTEVNPITNTFIAVMNVRVSGTGSALMLRYDGDSRVPRSPNSELRIYAVPENEDLVGSFRSYSSTWTDVTDSFTKVEKGNKIEYTTPSNTHTKYVVVSHGNYLPNLGFGIFQTRPIQIKLQELQRLQVLSF
ncbi:hypothetical protein BU202_06695 [Streptococcus cuniculi]|uniref:SDR-like Ig domain-containing protein n=1 Tax=Streptococcus cuniculi TaxID=1432788 RepID=A0A1Q8E7D6_9STRE|nr:Ig-like domain-containing protein [Streptococcus cuniculi]OLF47714.1 hypothetical protein BU202_06695 [Streptococcus cuniculi]